MKFSADRKDFDNALGLVKDIARRKQPQPILNTIQLVAKDETVTVLSTDLNMSISTSVELEGPCLPGVINVPCEEFTRIIGSLDDGEVDIELENDNRLFIKLGSTKFRLATLASESYPMIPKWPDGPRIRVPARILSNLINRTKISVSDVDEKMLQFQGMLLKATPTAGIGCISTDRNRLSIAMWKNADPERPEIKEIIHGLALKNLIGFLGAAPAESMIEISSAANHMFFRHEIGLFSSQKIAGDYPNYLVMIPGNAACKSPANDRVTAMSASRLVRALKRSGIMADERSKAVDLWFDKDSLRITSSSQAGEGEETLPVIWPHDPQRFRFNGQYLIDYLDALTADEFLFTTHADAGAKQPLVLICNEESLGIEHRYIMSPNNIREEMTEDEKHEAVAASSKAKGKGKAK
jgi:DNA polymerase-3 subunit beta